MKFYFAPLEGITGHVFRNVYHECFGEGIDKYFTPFLAPGSNKLIRTKEYNDILPEHNEGMYTVPQILCNDAEVFIKTINVMEHYGYSEFNLNLGCPSGTVVSKYRGSGFLAKPEALDEFLYEVYNAFSQTDIKISLKTRIGKDSPDEFENLLNIYNKYPVHELIIHPRIRNDFYKNTPNLEVFAAALQNSRNPVCYNGDIFKKDDYERITNRFPSEQSVMIGRGIIANPGLVQKILYDRGITKDQIRTFNYRMLEEYGKVLSGDKFILYKMKEIWVYMIHMFTNGEKYSKKMKKSERITDFKIALELLLNEQEIIQEAGFLGDKR